MIRNCLLRLALVVPVIALTTSSTQAKQSGTIYGQGNVSCGKWISGDALARTIQEAWVLGFISGAGWTGPETKKTDREGMSKWIDQYCAEHPLDTLDKATRELFGALKIKH